MLAFFSSVLVLSISPSHAAIFGDIDSSCKPEGVIAKAEERFRPIKFYSRQIYSGEKYLQSLELLIKRTAIDLKYKAETRELQVRRVYQENIAEGVPQDLARDLAALTNEVILKEIQSMSSMISEVYPAQMQDASRCIQMLHGNLGVRIQEECNFNYSEARAEGYSLKEVVDYLRRTGSKCSFD